MTHELLSIFASTYLAAIDRRSTSGRCDRDLFENSKFRKMKQMFTEYLFDFLILLNKSPEIQLKYIREILFD